jgi:hypothetical protein
MKVRHGIKQWAVISLLGALLVGALIFSSTLRAVAGWEKMDVCHVTNVPAEGDGIIINIADPAWDAHEAHGDRKIDPNDPLVTDNGDGTCHVSSGLDGPDAVDDAVTTPVDTPVTIDVLANDIYVEPVVVLLEVGPSHGLVGPWADGTITYTPDPGFSDTDSFTYRICDTAGQCDTATVIIIVGP